MDSGERRSSIQCGSGFNPGVLEYIVRIPFLTRGGVGGEVVVIAAVWQGLW